MMWYSGGGVHWWGWVLGTVAMAVFWGLLIWAALAIVGAVRSAGHPEDRPRGDLGEDPERILRRRFAAGEIDAEEYHRRLEVLRGELASRTER